MFVELVAALLLPVLSFSSQQSVLAAADTSPIDIADLFFGTEGGGHVFPGATRPNGMIKMGVDVIHSSSGDAYSGYAPDGQIVGISMMHESGTGGAPEYGVVAQLPYTANIDFNSQVYQTRSKADSASPGYYKATFIDGTIAEMAAADRSGMYSYEFPSGTTPKVIVNGSAHLTAPSRPWWTQYFVNGTVEADQEEASYTGETTVTGGWGEQSAWTIYYCGKFDATPTKVTTFEGSVSSSTGDTAKSTTTDGSMGLVFEFGSQKVKSKVGVSFISTDQACSNIDNDFPKDSWDFNSTVDDSRDLWNTKVFDKVSIATDDSSISNLIYSALYGAHLIPSNRTGENPGGWDSDEPYYDDFFTIWDTFRCLNPLYNVLSPTSLGEEIVRSLIDTYKHDGYMPDARSANQNGRTQGGSNADIVLADAYVKGVNGSIDWEDGYAAMVKDAEVQPPYKYDPFASDASDVDGRGALPDWLEYGWVTRKYTRCVTRTVEYAYDDFALYAVASGLGKDEDAQKYLKRSAGWQNIWNFNATSSKYNYTGFLQPKNADGQFNYTAYDPISCGGCYWSNDEYEAKPVEYGWSMPHDMQTLRSFIGSDEEFAQRLDDMFGLYGDSLADIGNEPSFLTPMLYNFINRQYRSVETIRYLINKNYKTGASGLPGNSDGGAMQAWLFWHLIGMYPVAGTTTYLLGSPFLPSVTLNLENGATMNITANSADFKNACYVQNVTVNGKTWNKNWVSHDDVFSSDGGWIHFELGTQATNWDTGSLPPSPGHYSLVQQ